MAAADGRWPCRPSPTRNRSSSPRPASTATAATRDITVGVSPEQASRVDGADVGTVLRKFRQLGAREQQAAGRTYLAVAGEGQVDVSNPRLGNDVYLAINRVDANGSTVGFGLTDPPIDTVLGGGRSPGRRAADGGRGRLPR